MKNRNESSVVFVFPAIFFILGAIYNSVVTHSKNILIFLAFIEVYFLFYLWFSYELGMYKWQKK